uniref:(northern house mosquito) hypothetical protein n=1 Tax=Culex pipiens TaxID=7175 RepID=A0A8D8FNY7_CULPI
MKLRTNFCSKSGTNLNLNFACSLTTPINDSDNLLFLNDSRACVCVYVNLCRIAPKGKPKQNIETEPLSAKRKNVIILPEYPPAVSRSLKAASMLAFPSFGDGGERSFAQRNMLNCGDNISDD